MVLVFAAVLEYAIANYLYRQSDGILARNSRYELNSNILVLLKLTDAESY